MNQIKSPLTVWLELTKKCNMRCIHCMVENEETSLSFQDAEKIISMLHEAKVFKLYITGGEPLLWNQLPELVGCAHSENIWTLVQTNGTLLTDSMAEKLVQNHVGAIDITVYGINAKTHDYITGSPGSFNKVLNAVQTCKQHGIKVLLSFMVLSHNLDELPNFFKWAESRGLGLLHVRRYIANSVEDPLRPLNPKFKESLTKSLDNLKSINANGEKVHVEFEESFLLHQSLGLNTCPAAHQLCSIDVEGRISPCPYIRYFGENILEQNFEDVWSNSKFLNQFRRKRSPDILCGTCLLQNECTEGCRAVALRVHSSLTAPNPNCWITKVIRV